MSATFLAATLSAEEMRQRLARLRSGAFKLAYVAPERLAYPGFRALVADLAPPLVAVDEAHCISEWGHDFRPDYLEIGALLAELRPPRVLACTATATPVVRDEILVRLGLGPDTPQMLRGFARPNLALRARHVATERERDRQVDAQLAEALGGPGAARGTAIVYAPTRRSTEEEAARLAGEGLAHRRLSRGDDRREPHARAAGLRGRHARGRGGDERLRHGHRPRRRARRRPPRPAGVGGGLLPGGGARGARRAGGLRPAPALARRPAAAPAADRDGRRRQSAPARGRGAQVEPLPRPHAVGGGRQLPPRRDPPLLRRRGGDARRLRPLRRLPRDRRRGEKRRGDERPGAQGALRRRPRATGGTGSPRRRSSSRASPTRGCSARASTGRRRSGRCAATPSPGSPSSCAAASPRAGWTSPRARSRSSS